MTVVPVPGATVLSADDLTGAMMLPILAGPQASVVPLADVAQFVSGLPAAKITTGTGATFAAGDITGALWVDYINNASNATLTTRTAAQMFGDIPNCQIGFAYKLAIRNLNATGATLTAANASVTLSGTMTIAQNVTRTFEVVFTAADACTITSMGISAAGA